MKPDGCLVVIQIRKTASCTFERYVDRQYPHGTRCVLAHEMDETYQKMSAEEKAKQRNIFGHINWGIHTQVPMPCRYVTLLRHPVDRVLSWYNMQKNYYNLAPAKKAVELWITNETEAQNGMTRQILGKGDTPEHAEKAFELLKTFDVVGITERFDAFNKTVHDLYGWNIEPALPNKNVAEYTDTFTERQRGQIEKWNRQDLWLYEKVKEELAP